MAEIDTAMVLAAGLGTRIRAIAAGKPKPLVEVGGRALIDYALDEVARGGAGRAVVNVHYEADQIEAHLKDRAAPAITISDERDARLETGGGLMRATPLLGEGPVFCTNTDAILEGGAARLAEGWRDAEMDALLLLVPQERTSGYAGSGDFCLGADGRVSWNGESEKLVFTGLQVIHPRLWAGEEPRACSTREFWDRAMRQGRLFGLLHDGFWMHVGDPDGHAAAEARLGRGR